MKKIFLMIMIMMLMSVTALARGSMYGGGSGVLTDSNCDQAKYYTLGKLCQDTDDGKL